jgi:hypothetical protein
MEGLVGRVKGYLNRFESFLVEKGVHNSEWCCWVRRSSQSSGLKHNILLFTRLIRYSHHISLPLSSPHCSTETPT